MIQHVLVMLLCPSFLTALLEYMKYEAIYVLENSWTKLLQKF